MVERQRSLTADSPTSLVKTTPREESYDTLVDATGRQNGEDPR
jgi:hypothetical protein